MTNFAWSRRAFISAVSATGAVTLTRGLRAYGLSKACEDSTRRAYLAFVGMTRGSGSESAEGRGPSQIGIYRVENANWTAAAAQVPADRPYSLALHPTLSVLYAVHNISSYRNLPCGSVSAFSFDRATGALTLLGQENLALSATLPEHIAVSPDGRVLLVSATGGGSYNVFSLAADGSLLPTPYPLKQIGSSPHPLQSSSNPRAAVFEKGGLSAYGIDLGADRINHIVFSDDDASERRAPILKSRVTLEPGSGPNSIVLHPSGALLTVATLLKPALMAVPIDVATGELLAPGNPVRMTARSSGPIAISESGDRVYVVTEDAAGNVAVDTFQLEIATGGFLPMQRLRVSSITAPRQLIRVDGELLLAGRGGVVSFPLDSGAGMVGEPTGVLSTPNAVSLAVHAA